MYDVVDTSDDDAVPSESVLDDVHRMLNLIDDERHLCADSLYQSIRTRLQQHQEAMPKSTPKSKSSASSHRGSPSRFAFRGASSGFSFGRSPKATSAGVDEHTEAQKLVEANRQALDTLEQRCRLFRAAKRDLNMNDDWTLAQKLFGITTLYRRENDGSLSIKMEGDIDGVSLFDQVAVLREVDLHYRWAPFCSSSLTVAHLDKLDTVGWFVVGLPNFGLMRDGCFRIVGCDSMAQDNSFVLVGQGIADRPSEQQRKPRRKLTRRSNSTESANSLDSVEMEGSGNFHIGTDGAPVLETNVDDESHLRNDSILQQLDIPEPPTRFGAGRVTIRKFQATIQVHSPTKASTKVVTNINPNLAFIPQSLLEFVMKKMCGVVVARLQQAAKKVSKDPIANPHARKMRDLKDFYEGWLWRKFIGTCKNRGWEMPSVPALELSEPDLAVISNQSREHSDPTLRSSHDIPIPPRNEITHSVSDFPAHPPYQPKGQPIPLNDAHNQQNRLERQKSQDSDAISEMSQSTTSVATGQNMMGWKNNRLAVYLKEIEERIQNRKDDQVGEARDRAAERLRPKQLEPEKQNRLRELRAAKARREFSSKAELDTDACSRSTHSGSGSVGSSDHTPMQHETVGEVTPRADSRHFKSYPRRDWTNIWGSHRVLTRFIIMAALVLMLFAVLHMDSISRFSPQEFMFSPIPRDPWYMDVIRDVFTLSYLAVSSFVHFCLCYVALMYSFSALELGMKAGRRARTFYSANVHLGVGLLSFFIFVLGIAEALFGIALRKTKMVGVDPGAPNWRTWRWDAFVFSRLLFTYSSVFLLVLLSVFNLMARKSRVKNIELDPRENIALGDVNTQISMDDPPELSLPSELLRRSKSVSFDETEEQDTVKESHSGVDDTTRRRPMIAFSPLSANASMGSGSDGKRRKVGKGRLLRKLKGQKA